ncbi:MAG TPA: hypothetical protein VH475_19420 [Tepidisphaeraceae bacterium]|jgi:hypothetical protein
MTRARRLLEDLSPTCRHAARLLSHSMDGRLSRPQRIGLRIHLLLCRLCRRYRRNLVVLRQIMRRLPEIPDSSQAGGLSVGARVRIRTVLERGA